MYDHKLAITQIEPFRSYTDLFVQRIPHYVVKTPGRSWTTKNKPLSDIPVAAHLLGKYAVAVLGKWYPEFAIIDIDDRPRGTVDELRERLELNSKNSMLFTSESADSYHLLLRPEYKEKPPTVRLLNNAFRSFCDLHKVELYPQPGHAVRLPFGPAQLPLDFEYSGLGSWQDKLYWFQKLNEFDITSVKGQQFVFDFTLQKSSLPTIMEDGQYLFEHGLQAPGSRHEAQFKVIYLLWRRNVPIDTTRELTFNWIRKKHNGFSKDILAYPGAVQKEIARQTAHVYEKYEFSKTYPDSTHNLFNGFITRPDMEEIVRIARGSLPRMRFLFNLVKFYYPRRFRAFVNVHSDRLIEWASRRVYDRYLDELENQGIIKRGSAYQPGLFSKAIRLNWTFKSSSAAVLYDGRAIETLEETARTTFKPAEFKALLESIGLKTRWTYELINRIWGKSTL
jgi:hypothetical protein